MMDASDSALDHIILNGWPSCTDCISWSSDGELAVATGEYVHILTPKQAPKSGTLADPGMIGLRQWHSARIRTNVFTQREWPNQDLNPSHSFSVGEEQSLSSVVGLAWSPPGIGPHRRSVLAVLTSNHVLSLWESNGTVGEWARVFVVNHPLGDYFGWVDEAGLDVYREKRRIRAFAWSPPYQVLQADDEKTLNSKWGAIYLAVANDEEVVIVLSVSKPKRGCQREWNVKVTSHINLLAVSTYADGPHVGSLFHKVMMTKSPVSSLSWSAEEDKFTEPFIRIARHHCENFIKAKASLNLTRDGSFHMLKPNLVLNAVHWEDSRQRKGHHDPQSKRIAEYDVLKKAMEEERIKYDSTHSLHGNSMVREWGFASSDTQSAACITIHPSDMVEYNTASLQKCNIVFAFRSQLRGNPRPLKSSIANPPDVVLNVISWILSAANDIPLILPIDRRLLGISASYAYHSDQEEVRQKGLLAFSRLRQTAEAQIGRDEMVVDESAPVASLTCPDIEMCLICGALIAFDENDLGRAWCETGHPYSRVHNEVSFYDC